MTRRERILATLGMIGWAIAIAAFVALAWIARNPNL